MYKKLVYILTNYISAELDLDEVTKDKVRFGIEVIISSMITLFLTLIIAVYIDIVIPVSIILIIGALLKVFTGGIHFKTIYECSIFTAITVNGLGLLVKNGHSFIGKHIHTFIIATFLYIILSLIFWSPVESDNRPINSYIKKKRLKYISILLVIVTYIFILLNAYILEYKLILINSSLIFGLLLNAITINPLIKRLLLIYYKKRRY